MYLGVSDAAGLLHTLQRDLTQSGVMALQVFHSKCEIFKSNHEDIVSTQSVMNTCKVLQLPQWCTYHAEGDSHRQAPNGPHNNTRPFDKAATADAPTEAAATAKPPATSENGASASKPKSDPTPPSPNAAAPDPPAKPDAANDARPAANGSTHRGKRKLADRPAAAPNSAARRVVAEPSPEPEPPASGSRGAKAASTKNGSAAGENAAKKKNEGKAAAAGDGEGAEGGSDGGTEREGSPMVFLCRHAYDAKRHKWVDEEVPLYCVCCMPYNPDLDMVECVRCGEWCVPGRLDRIAFSINRCSLTPHSTPP